MVFDTSALLAFLRAEPGGDVVRAQLEAGGRGEEALFLSGISLTELRYLHIRRYGDEQAERVLQSLLSLPVRIIYPDEVICRQAGAIKAVCQLSLADSLIAATAMVIGATLMHKDAEFLPLAPKLAQEYLGP